jgi:hypothetical protein
MSVRTLTVVLVAASLAFGAWKVLKPQAQEASREAGDDVAAVLATTGSAKFTGAAASLEIQRRTTGTYAGARLAAGTTLARADATSYCVQARVGAQVLHLAGPGGAPAPGGC